MLRCRSESKQRLSWLWRASAGGQKREKNRSNKQDQVEGSSTQQSSSTGTGLEGEENAATLGNLDVGTGRARESEREWEMGETMPEVEPSRRQPWRGRQAVAQMTIRRDPRGFELWHYTRTRRSFKAGASAARTGLPAQGLALSCWEQLQVTRGGDPLCLLPRRHSPDAKGAWAIWPSGMSLPHSLPHLTHQMSGRQKDPYPPQAAQLWSNARLVPHEMALAKLDLTSNFWYK